MEHERAWPSNAKPGEPATPRLHPKPSLAISAIAAPAPSGAASPSRSWLVPTAALNPENCATAPRNPRRPWDRGGFLVLQSRGSSIFRYISKIAVQHRCLIRSRPACGAKPRAGAGLGRAGCPSGFLSVWGAVKRPALHRCARGRAAAPRPSAKIGRTGATGEGIPGRGTEPGSGRHIGCAGRRNERRGPTRIAQDRPFPCRPIAGPDDASPAFRPT